MRFLMVMSWKPEKAHEISERFKQWTPSEGLEIILPTHTVMGRNQGISVIEVDDPMVLAKLDRGWRDIATFKSYPIMESSEIIKVKL